VKKLQLETQDQKEIPDQEDRMDFKDHQDLPAEKA